jgi:hypothetical protein
MANGGASRSVTGQQKYWADLKTVPTGNFPNIYFVFPAHLEAV